MPLATPDGHRDHRGLRGMLGDLGSHRRWVAAALVATAVVTGVAAMRPPATRLVAVWAAARDLPGGQPLRASDVTASRLPPDAVPQGALRARDPVVGRLLGAPVRKGEPLTDVRLISGDLLDALGTTGEVAVPIRVADGAAALTVSHPGELVDVLGSGDPDAAAGPAPGAVAPPGEVGPGALATGLRVLAVPPVTASGDDSGIVVVAATRRQAAVLAAASSTQRLSVAVTVSASGDPPG